MNGPDHYAMAERLLTTALSYEGIENLIPAQRALSALGQAHATLALTAATIAASQVPVAMPWIEAIS